MNNIIKKNSIVYCIFSFNPTTTIANGTSFAKIPKEYNPSYGSGFFAPLYDTNGNTKGVAWVSVSGDIFYYGTTSLASNVPIYTSFSYMQ